METTMEQVGKTIHKLLLDDRFFCYFLSGIDRMISSVDPQSPRYVPYAGVGKSDTLSYVMLINPEGWDKLGELGTKYNLPKFRGDVLKHEALHIAYQHPTIGHMFKYRDIANIAMDLEINQYLDSITQYNKGKKIGDSNDAINAILADTSLSKEEQKAKISEYIKTTDPVFMTLDAFGWQDDTNKGSLYYYDKLIAAADKWDKKMEAMECDSNCQGPGQGQGESDQEGKEQGNGESKSKDSKGKGKGQGKGQGQQGQGDANEDAIGEMISNMRANKDFADAIREMIGNGNWKDFSKDPSDTDNSICNNKVKLAIKEFMQRSQNIGDIPAGIQAQLDELMKDKKPVADWKRILSVFTARCVSYFTKTSRRKLNKRHEDFAAIKIKSQVRIFATIDTSGSMGSEGVKEVLSEVENIRRVNKAILDLGECDCELYVREICTVDRQTVSTKTSYSGGGGTSVEPAIRYVNDNLEKYACFIYLTDGWVPPSSVKCKVPMITVVIKDGLDEDGCKKLEETGMFGKVIKTR